ncbi:lasso RiPP family leader peptide-containing protein [Marispirochaeta aestuarii]|jgi:hypothetical protein|nr:lasso RiPP family leader peptide-containing protein [Marispirochaeta aestuarii]
MKKYESPQLVILGDIAELTRGEGWRGNSDSFWIFSWGVSG